MTDLEMTKLCADAMELDLGPDWNQGEYVMLGGHGGHTAEVYDPLDDDAQMMELARKFPLEFEMAVIEWCNHVRRSEPFSLNYEFCGRVAEKQRDSGPNRLPGATCAQ